jgi:hypothetical protein
MHIYGNPSHETVLSIRDSILLRQLCQSGIMEQFSNIPYPSDIETIDELYMMLSMKVDSNRMAKIEEYELDLYGTMSRFLDSYGIIKSKEEIEQMLSIYEPITDYLKVRYNRPRPHYMAGIYNVPLYPKLKTDASSSAYPSGHTLTSMWFRHHIIKSHPELKKPLMDFVLDIKRSREEGGVHYPSDGAFSILIYQRIKNSIEQNRTDNC